MKKKIIPLTVKLVRDFLVLFFKVYFNVTPYLVLEDDVRITEKLRSSN